MKWIKELPKEEGYYITLIDDNGKIKVRPILWKKDVLYGYIKPDESGVKTCYAWMDFPEWDDENWNNIPYWLDDTNWRDYCPKEDGRYIVKSINGWVPHERKAIHTQYFSNGHWKVYPNKDMNPKYDFVHGWMELPKPFDVTDQEPIYDYQRGIGLNDKAKQSLKELHDEVNFTVLKNDKEYRKLFDVEKGFVLIPKEEYINQNSNEIHEYGVMERMKKNEQKRNDY